MLMKGIDPATFSMRSERSNRLHHRDLMCELEEIFNINSMRYLLTTKVDNKNIQTLICTWKHWCSKFELHLMKTLSLVCNLDVYSSTAQFNCNAGLPKYIKTLSRNAIHFRPKMSRRTTPSIS